MGAEALLRGSFDLVSRAINKVTIVIFILITPIKVLITLLTESHDPPIKLTAKPRTIRCFSGRMRDRLETACTHVFACVCECVSVCLCVWLVPHPMELNP